jgi:hypothetical protein
MKLLLSCVAACAAVAALAQASFASTQQCADTTFPFLPVDVTCPSAGTLNNIKSVSHISAAAGQTLWTYSTDMQVGPSSAASPRAAADLITSTGAFAVNINGIQCPESVDITVGNGAQLPAKNCQTVAAGQAGNPRKVRIFHQHI